MTMEVQKYYLKIETCLFCIYLLAPLVSSFAYSFDLKVKYFSDVSMFCDHPDLNITDRADVSSLAWVFPDGSTHDSARKPDPKYFQLSGPSPSLSAHNLTVLSVDDPVFGYYICIVMYHPDEKPVSVIRWGLNVDGADFTELLKSYEENAIVGGIAAAALLVLVGTGCLVWHFRYDNRHSKLSTQEDENAADIEFTKSTMVAYDNETYIPGDEVDGDEEEKKHEEVENDIVVKM